MRLIPWSPSAQCNCAHFVLNSTSLQLIQPTPPKLAFPSLLARLGLYESEGISFDSPRVTIRHCDSKGKFVSTRTIQPAKNILLTGAGFTKPYGGYLATEMWALILNEPEIHTYSRLRNCLLANRNFEVAYDLVLLSDDYSEPEKEAFINALRRTYEHLHRSACVEFHPRAMSSVASSSQNLVR